MFAKTPKRSAIRVNLPQSGAKVGKSPLKSVTKKPNGRAVLTFENRYTLECELVGGRAEGKGTKTYADGDVLTLRCDGWKDGEANGKGVMKFANGDVFECTFIDGYENGLT
jgi:hypothetical protein